MQRNVKHQTSLAALSVLFVLILLLAMLITVPASVVDAQSLTTEATATPRDPVWLGFSTARSAIEEQENTDLAIVQRWDFFQDDWTLPNAAHPESAAGIDSCLSTVGIAQGRRVFFGWTYVITALNGNRYEARVSFDLEDVAVCDIQTEGVAAAPVAAADDTATNADLPAPVAGAGATGSFELGGHIDGLTGEAQAALQRSGMTWIKQQLPVSAGVGKGIEFINSAHANGFKILLGVVGDREALAADPQAYAPDYATFVAALAEAGADGIEVWNEPNIDREWPTGQINGANYTALLAVAFNAIKGANPNTIVISGAPAPTGFFGAAGCTANGCNDDVFMQQMAQAGAAQFMDCLGLHYNEGVLSPSAFSGDPRGNFPTYFFSSMVNRGAQFFPGTQLCFTELGYLSAEGMGAPIPPAFDWTPNDPVTVAEQAAWLADAAARLAQRGDTRLMIVWNVNFKRFDSDPMGGYAIIRPDGTCPACDTLGAVMGG